MTDTQTKPGRGIAVVRLTNSVESFGMVLDLLSKHRPFRDFDLGQLAATVRQQLGQEMHIAALKDGRLIGYIGGLWTSQTLAENWMNNVGPLRSVPRADADAVVATIAMAPDSEVLRQMVRIGLSGLPNLRVFFKRQRLENPRKTSIRNRFAPPPGQ